MECMANMQSMHAEQPPRPPCFTPRLLPHELNLHIFPGSLAHRVAYGNSDSDEDWVRTG